jgi:hypothetical protein
MDFWLLRTQGAALIKHNLKSEKVVGVTTVVKCFNSFLSTEKSH